MTNAINFYDEMCRAFKEKSGFEVYEDSDVGIRFSAVAAAMSNLLNKAEDCVYAGSIEKCSSEMLDLYAKEYGITRKSGAPAKVTLIMRINTVFLDADIVIPKGTLVGDKNGNIFATDNEITFGTNSISETVTATAVTSGKITIKAQTLTNFCSAVPPVVSVTNSESVTSGEDAESDSSLRYRLIQLHKKFPCSINNDGIRAVSLQHPSIKDAHVMQYDDKTLVYVDVYDKTNFDTESFTQYLFEHLPITINVAALPCDEKEIDITLTVKNPENADYKDSVKEKIREYFDFIKIGQQIDYAKLYAILNEANFCESFLLSDIDDFCSLGETEKYTVRNISFVEV